MISYNSVPLISNYGMIEKAYRFFGMREVTLYFNSDGTVDHFSRRWSVLSQTQRDFIYGIKRRVCKTADKASNIFSGVRSGFDLMEVVGFRLSQIVDKFLQLTKVFDFFDVPYTVSLIAKDFFCIFAIGSLSEKVDSFFTFVTDLDTFFYRGAKFFTLLNKFEIVSGHAIEWCDVFYVLSFFISFIHIRRDTISCRRAFIKVRSLEKNRSFLQDMNSAEQKQKIVLHILKKLREKDAEIKERTLISKKALRKKIFQLKKDVLDASTSVSAVNQVDELLRLLVTRTKKIGVLSSVGVVNSVAFAVGAALGLFTPFAVASVTLMSVYGLVSCVMWGGKLLFIKKDPWS